MDYELKCVIAICFLVKIAALSPEFPIGKETENPEQSPGPVEPRFLASSAASNSPVDRWTLLDRDPGRRKFNQMKDVAKPRKVKESQTFDLCERKLELLESSLKWRDIRKTLHWLERILASNLTRKEICHGKTDLTRRSSSKERKVSKKKIKNNAELNLEKILLNDSKASIHSKKNKKVKKERSHKHRLWKNRSREEKNRKEKFKSKQKSRFDKNYFQKKDLMKLSWNNPHALNTTILKPGSVLYDDEKNFFKRMKSKSGNFNTECVDSVVKIIKHCGKTKKTQREGVGNPVEVWSADRKLGHPESDRKSPKQKPWPHFVYHRVSSNFLHPDSTKNHKQSAYIAISVVSSSKPDSADNNL